MDTVNLEVFVAAISERSLSGAARRLKLTPMAVTRRIAALELEVGVRLIHRSTRAISLTSEGESFLPLRKKSWKRMRPRVPSSVHRRPGRRACSG